MQVKYLISLLVIPLSLVATAALAGSGPSVVAEIKAGPLWLAYYDTSPAVEATRPAAHPKAYKSAGMKEELYGWVYDITAQCNVDLHQCWYGWDLFQGKDNAPLKKWLSDVMVFAQWGDANTGGGDRYGERYVSKSSHDSSSIARTAATRQRTGKP